MEFANRFQTFLQWQGSSFCRSNESVFFIYEEFDDFPEHCAEMFLAETLSHLLNHLAAYLVGAILAHGHESLYCLVLMIMLTTLIRPI